MTKGEGKPNDLDFNTLRLIENYAIFFMWFFLLNR